MALQDAWGFDGKTYSGQEMRLQVAALTGGRGGVSEPDDMVATPQAAPNNTVVVSAGTAIVPATHAGDLGSYEVPNDAAMTSPTFAAAGGSGRRDLLLLEVTAGVPALKVIQGTPSGSPVYPSLAAEENYIVVCGVFMPAGKSIIDNGGVNGSIEDRRSLWPARVVCTSSTRPPIPFDGQHIYETDTSNEYTYHSFFGLWYRTYPSPYLCTSVTRPNSFLISEGQHIYETDTDKEYVWDGAQFVQTFQRDATTYTPGVKNSGQAPVTKTVTYAKYTRVGKRIRAICRVDVTGNSGGTGQIQLDLPVDCAVDSVFQGTAWFFDSSANTPTFGGALVITSSTPDSVTIVRDQSAGVTAVTTQLGTGDWAMYQVEYEAASF